MKWVVLLMLLLSCTNDTGYNGNVGQEETEGTLFPFSSFSTRLSNNLLISGTKCEGGEVADFEGRTFGCEPEQWLVIVDDVNRCTPEGCTTVEVRPMIAELLFFTGDGNINFFTITPSIPLSADSERHLEEVLLRVDQTSGAIVVPR